MQGSTGENARRGRGDSDSAPSAFLVVNADDAGVDSARNRGILYAFKWGIVRSASVLSGWPSSAEFVKAARAVRGPAGERIDLGLHLNVTEGVPLVSGHTTLVGSDGKFLGKFELWKRALNGQIDPAEARREVRAQLDWLDRHGAKVSHLDGHNHAHLLPGIAEAVGEETPPGLWVRANSGTPGWSMNEDPPELFREPARL